MELQSLISGVLAAHCDVINRRIVARWNNMVGIKGKAVADPALIAIIGTAVVASMNYSGQKAWIAEYGSGSLMSRDNPYLSEYKSSSNYNPLRLSDGSITGRPMGNYRDLDGNPQYSSGRNAGKDLELKPVYSTMYPAKVIQEEIKAGEAELVIAIQGAVAGYTVAMMTMTTEVYL